MRSGAHWRVVHRSEQLAVVELQQCTGEPVERRESREAAVITYLDGIDSDDDLPLNDA